MSLPRVGVLGRTRRNTRSSAQVIETRTQEMTIFMDVDKIHMSEYYPTNMHIEEEQNPIQEVE
jgi:hypothetical protein